MRVLGSVTHVVDRLVGQSLDVKSDIEGLQRLLLVRCFASSVFRRWVRFISRLEGPGPLHLDPGPRGR